MNASLATALKVLTCLALLVALLGCERWALDRQMEALCAKDGGVKVYEAVTLPASEFSNVGQPLARYAQISRSGTDYFGPDYKYVNKREILVGKNARVENGEGVLARTYSAVYRRSDDKLLGESVLYSRGGGDFFTFGFQPSGNVCPLRGPDLAKSIFLKGE